MSTTKKAASRVGSGELVRHPGLYRAKLSCKIGRDAIEGIRPPPAGCTAAEYAIFNLLHAVEEIADAMMPKIRVRHRRGNAPEVVCNRLVRVPFYRKHEQK